MTALRSNDSRYLFPGLLSILVMGYFTYVEGYSTPAAFYWDENYHIPAAQKYLHGIFFMEPHPPLGKLLIAVGEWLLAANPDSNQFIAIEHAKGLPTNFSFAGYRLVPVILAWLAGAVFYLVIWEVTRKPLMAWVCSSLYLFDNSLIVHNRGAMLEGPQLFFLLLTLLFFFRGAYRRAGLRNSFFLGTSLGLLVAVKVNGLILAPLPIVLALFSGSIRRGAVSFVTAYAACLLPIALVWAVHIHSGRTIVATLPDKGYYHASDAHRSALDTNGPLPWITAVRDNMAFTSRYEAGVPILNLCKVGENGSYPVFWPIGGSSINYRWERAGSAVRYLYLQSNPVGWFAALTAVLLVTACLLVRAVNPMAPAVPYPAAVLTALYWLYFGVVLSVDRVLYLYHYFIPLIFGYVLIPYALGLVQRIGTYPLTDKGRLCAVGALAIAVFSTFLYFKPLTYYEPLQNSEVTERAWLNAWRLRCVDCPLPSFLAIPCAKAGS